jgi:predicted nuclease with TOPRIM domain
MQLKKAVCFFSMLLLLSTLMFSVDAAADTNVSFRGSGVTIAVTYPEEARPNSTITHNIRITADTIVTLKNFTVVIKAPLVNSSWQVIVNGTNGYEIPPELPQNYNLTLPLSQDANGMLQCFIFVNTSSIEDLSATFYTTLVSDPIFSDMRVLYDEMLANYTGLREDYDTLFSDYNELYVNYTSLMDNYTTLLADHNQLVADHGALQEAYENISSSYESLNTTYMALLSEHNQLTINYNNKVSDYDTLDDDLRASTTELGNLQTVYSALNGTYYSLQTEFNKLQIDSSTLNQTYNNLQTAFTDLQGQLTDSQSAVNAGNIVMFIFVVAVAALIAFIVYIKRKQEDPYLVIRKETVSVKSDEET